MAPFKPVKVYLLTQAFGVGGALLFAAAGIAFSSMKTDHWAYLLGPVMWLSALQSRGLAHQ